MLLLQETHQVVMVIMTTMPGDGIGEGLQNQMTGVGSKKWLRYGGGRGLFQAKAHIFVAHIFPALDRKLESRTDEGLCSGFSQRYKKPLCLGLGISQLLSPSLFYSAQ